MTIELVTGVPGAGKTAYVVNKIRGMVRDSERAADEGRLDDVRKLFVWGIPDLKIPHVQCPPVEEWTRQEDNPEAPGKRRWVFRFPPGSIIVIDECQDVYRVRSSSSAVPPHVAALERHRHTGLDIFLLTQKPRLIDPQVREFVGLHIHCAMNWTGRKLYEWSEAANPYSRADLADAVTRRYSIPRDVFDLYRSATCHTKLPRRKPYQLFVLVVALVVLALGVAYFRGRFFSPDSGSSPPRSSAPVSGPPTTKEEAAPVRASASPLGGQRVRGGDGTSARMRLVSFAYAAVAGKVLVREWVAEDLDGRRVRVPGGQCVGEGQDAQCHVDGVLVSYGPGAVPASVSGGVVADAAVLSGGRVAASARPGVVR